MTINPFEVKFKTFCEKLENPIYIKENSLIFISGDSGSGKSVFLSHVFKQKEFKTKTYYQHTNSYPPLNYKVKEVISLLSVPDGDYNKFINFISNYFDINKFLNKRIKELSGGERSFIGLISSLFSNKEIIMLDEPLNMISDERREKAADLIKEVSKYKTIFVISHFKEIFSNIADVIIKIDNGNIETTYLDKKTDTTTTNSSSFIRSKRKTKIWRYVKDDFPLVLVFFVIVLSLQFLTIFSATGIENEKIRVKSSFDLIDETMGKVMVTNNPPPTSIPDEKTQYPDDGDDINGIKIINTYYGKSIIAVKPIGNVLKNFGYYQNISFLSEEELKNGNYKSNMSDGFEMPIISKISDNYNGKKDNFEVNDVIITNNFIKNLSSYLCSYFNITPNINIDDNINKISDKLKKHDFQNKPIKLTYFDISKSLKNVSTADYNVINDDETILKTINIVGFDFDYKSSHYFLRPYSCYEKNSDPFSDYLEITASSFDKRCQIVNISYSSPEEVAGLLNKSLIAKKDFTSLRSLVEDHSPIVVADAIKLMDYDQAEDKRDVILLFKTIQNEYTAEIFSYLDQDQQQTIVEAFSEADIQNLIRDMSTDDLIDFVEELPSNLVSKVLQATDKENRGNINRFLNYNDDSAGSIMTSEYVEIKKTATAKEALDKIKSIGKGAETVATTFVVDESRKLIGTLSLEELVFAKDDTPITEIMNTDYTEVYTNTDQEEVARIFKKYDIPVLPVVNTEGRLLGIITFDDVMDVIEEENTEDLQKMAAITPVDTPYLKTGVFKLAKSRVVWLLVLMLSATLTGLLLNNFESLLMVVPVLTVFVPMLMDTSGNAGNQTTTVVTRALALGEVKLSDYPKVLWKEFRVALITGLFISAFNFAWIFIELKTGIIDATGGATNYPEWLLALLVSLTMYLIIVMAKTLGSSLPMLAKLIHLDPALMAGPLITTILDVSSLAVYFLLAKLILGL